MYGLVVVTKQQQGVIMKDPFSPPRCEEQCSHCTGFVPTEILFSDYATLNVWFCSAGCQENWALENWETLEELAEECN